MNEPSKIGYTLKPFQYTLKILVLDNLRSTSGWFFFAWYISMVVDGIAMMVVDTVNSRSGGGAAFTWSPIFVHGIITVIFLFSIWCLYWYNAVRQPKFKLAVTRPILVRFDSKGVCYECPDYIYSSCTWEVFDSVYRLIGWTVLCQGSRRVLLIPDHAFESQASFEAFKLDVMKLKGGTRLKF